MRVIIRQDHALLFEPDTDTAQRFLDAVLTRDRGSAVLRESRNDGPGVIGSALNSFPSHLNRQLLGSLSVRALALIPRRRCHSR